MKLFRRSDVHWHLFARWMIAVAVTWIRVTLSILFANFFNLSFVRCYVFLRHHWIIKISLIDFKRFRSLKISLIRKLHRIEVYEKKETVIITFEKTHNLIKIKTVRKSHRSIRWIGFEHAAIKLFLQNASIALSRDVGLRHKGEVSSHSKCQFMRANLGDHGGHAAMPTTPKQR